jgi:hypothetical protein
MKWLTLWIVLSINLIALGLILRRLRRIEDWQERAFDLLSRRYWSVDEIHDVDDVGDMDDRIDRGRQ